jgi:hypothetical protein
MIAPAASWLKISLWRQSVSMAETTTADARLSTRTDAQGERVKCFGRLRRTECGEKLGKIHFPPTFRFSVRFGAFFCAFWLFAQPVGSDGTL